MAVRDILTLSNPVAPRLIRCLYIVALVLIAVMVVFGLAHGVRIMLRPPLPRPAISASTTAATDTTSQANSAPQPPRPDFTARRQAFQHMMMARRFRRPRGPFGGEFGPGPFPRMPLLSGAAIIFFTLLRGIIVLLVVRILAELALAILAMPRSKEI